MAKTNAPGVKTKKRFIDVLVLTNKPEILPQLEDLFNKRGVSFKKLPVDAFSQIRDQLDLIGTVIINASGLSVSQQNNLDRIIETLDAENISSVLLNSWVTLPRRKHSLLATLVSATLEELWGKVSANIAYRKRFTALARKGSAPPLQTQEAEEADQSEQATAIEAADAVEAADESTLAAQVRMAGRVQRDFLPSSLPNSKKVRWATVFEPAEWVSGDIYDITRLDEQHISFYIADAVGHSMPAALLTMFLKQALVMRETIENDYLIFPPKQVIENLNIRMARQKLSGCQFATCCYCLLNIKTLQMTFSRAGHPYPLLIRPAQEPELLQIRGSLLGIFEQAEFTQQTIQLQQADKLLLYSDGAEPFIGKTNQQGGFDFSKEFYQIKDLPIEQILTELAAQAGSKSKQERQLDDITAIGLEIL